MKGCTAFVLLFVVLFGAPSLASGAPLAAPASQPEAPDFHAPLLERARELAASGRPLELLVASRLAYSQELGSCPRASGQPCQSDVWLGQAIREGSEQPLIARAAVSRCIHTKHCDIAAAIQTLRTREADDAVAQLLLWRLAVVRGNDDEAALAWARVTQATRYVDEYAEGLDVLDRMTRGLLLPLPDDAVQSSPDEARLTLVYALTAAFSTQALVDLQRQCPAPADASRSAGCRHLLTLMANSREVLASSYGSARMQVYALDAAEREHWQQRRREVAWVLEKASALLSGGTERGPAPDMQEYLRQSVESGELGAMRQLLAANHIQAKPPADWQPTMLSSN